MHHTGNLAKMSSVLIDKTAIYTLNLNNQKIELNHCIGKKISIQFNQQIFCVACGKKTKKSFAQGFCYNCFINSPENAPCIIRPELCEAHLGKGRDVAWEIEHHLQPHTVYLSYASGLKVGVTRDTQIPTRWIDQGAVAAIVLAKTPNRYLAGVIEVFFKQYLADKTNWQQMLKLENGHLPDLIIEKEKYAALLSENLKPYISKENDCFQINYPVTQKLAKIQSLNLDKTPYFEAILTGIKGQYLLFDDSTVFNVRNYSGYQIKFHIDN